jgi:hypothetical protein
MRLANYTANFVRQTVTCQCNALLRRSLLRAEYTQRVRSSRDPASFSGGSVPSM